MAFIYHNANPFNKRSSDCVIRGISVLTGDSWDEIYTDLSLQGFLMKDMMTANNVWGSYLRQRGYIKFVCPCETCCYTVSDFCNHFSLGKYLVCTGSHVVAIVNGNYYDTWDSGDEIVDYYWKKETFE